jgi:hypothetical protein
VEAEPRLRNPEVMSQDPREQEWRSKRERGKKRRRVGGSLCHVNHWHIIHPKTQLGIRISMRLGSRRRALPKIKVPDKTRGRLGCGLCLPLALNDISTYDR